VPFKLNLRRYAAGEIGAVALEPGTAGSKNTRTFTFPIHGGAIQLLQLLQLAVTAGCCSWL
jgi:hypothetical protein